MRTASPLGEGMEMGGIASCELCTNNRYPEGGGPDDGTTILRTPMEARSGREQQQLARRMRPRGAGRSAGAVEDAGDVARVCHNIEDTHATAAFAADGDGDGESGYVDGAWLMAETPRKTLAARRC